LIYEAAFNADFFEQLECSFDASSARLMLNDALLPIEQQPEAINVMLQFRVFMCIANG